MDSETWNIARKLAGIPAPPSDSKANGNGHTNGQVQLQRSGLTDLANAERFAKRHGDRLCYSEQMGWFVYDGRRWLRDTVGEAARCAKETAISILEEAAHVSDDKERAALVKHQRHSESQRAQRAMLEAAQTEPGIYVDSIAFDANPHLLNCRNGTLDLSTGAFRNHDRTDMLTKLAPVDFDPDAKSELWEAFLDEATGGDVDYMAFLQRAAGYSLGGDTSEEKLFFIHGPGASGKSTFIEALKSVLGDYAMTADFETFLQRSFVGGARNDIARLAGARFVSSMEVEQGRKLAEGLVKSVTGGDIVTARYLYKESFEFTPQFKLWLVANHQPKARDDDDALWRRILRLPFERVVPKERRDPSIKARLRDPDVSGPAILAWAFKGYQEWHKIGLAVPERVDKATEAYKAEMNPITDFLSECCVLDPNSRVTVAALWDIYQKWAGAGAMGRSDFKDRLEAKGVRPAWVTEAGKQARGWKGIGLLESTTVQHTSHQNG